MDFLLARAGKPGSPRLVNMYCVLAVADEASSVDLFSSPGVVPEPRRVVRPSTMIPSQDDAPFVAVN